MKHLSGPPGHGRQERDACHLLQPQPQDAFSASLKQGRGHFVPPGSRNPRSRTVPAQQALGGVCTAGAGLGGGRQGASLGDAKAGAGGRRRVRQEGGVPTERRQVQKMK